MTPSAAWTTACSPAVSGGPAALSAAGWPGRRPRQRAWRWWRRPGCGPGPPRPRIRARRTSPRRVPWTASPRPCWRGRGSTTCWTAGWTSMTIPCLLPPSASITTRRPTMPISPQDPISSVPRTRRSGCPCASWRLSTTRTPRWRRRRPSGGGTTSSTMRR